MDDADQQMLAAFRRLAPQDRQALQAFAEFLAARNGSAAPDEPVAAPQPEPRPEGESVVMAIKRLTRTYPMLDRRKLMGPTSLLVSQHAHGRAAVQIIDELELVFELHYSDLVSPKAK
jgi:hypothetical protein